jgi:IS5 family transposase
MSAGQPGFWDVQERLRELSAQGDPLEKLAATVDFEIFRAELDAPLGPRDRAKGGRPSFDPVLKFRMLVLQAMEGLSLAQTEYLVADRLSWMRFCRLGPGDAVPDANTLWDFREALIAAGALDALFVRLDRAITEAGYLPMAGQIVDATLVAAPRPRNTAAEQARIKAGETARGAEGNARRAVHLARPAGQGAPEGHGCALDGEVQQGPAARGWHAAVGAEGNARRAVHRRPGLRLQIAHLDRPPARGDPTRQDHRCRGL